MDKNEQNRIDLLTETVHNLLKGGIPEPVVTENDPDDEIRRLGEKINSLVIHFKQIREAVGPLSEGRLDVEIPRGNFLASPFKQLRASLAHLTWQTRRIAGGDFDQQVDFMGDFSQAFNSMVNALKETRSQLVSEIERYKDLAEIKNRYLNVLAHDIRTPLGAIIGFCDLLFDGRLPGRGKEQVSIIRRNCDALLSLINNILDMARLEKKKMVLESRPFSIREVCEDTAALIQYRVNEQVGLNIDIDPLIPRTLVGDPHRLRQVLINLMGNAAKFTHKGEIRLKVRNNESAPQSSGTFHLRFSVEDTGIGIEAEDMKKLFAPFSQAGSDTASRYGGTGLGLAISKELTELMGGRLTLSSRPGVGTVFTFTLPFAVHHETGRDQPSPDLPSTGTGRILVADDNDDALKIIERMLKGKNVRYTLCNNGSSAMELIVKAHNEGDPYTLGWLDIDMPEIDGVELAERIRADKRFRSMRLVACSAYSERFLKGNLPSYFSFITTKPVTPQALSRILNESSSGHFDDDACDFSGLRILVTDDNPINRFIVKSILGEFDVHVKEAENGKDACAMSADDEFDIILMDQMMPAMNGMEAIRIIRSLPNGRRPLIMAFTANDANEDIQDMIQAGADGLLQKPAGHEKLFDIMCLAVKRRNSS